MSLHQFKIKASKKEQKKKCYNLRFDTCLLAQLWCLNFRVL
jgi:hypothetical protein